MANTTVKTLNGKPTTVSELNVSQAEDEPKSLVGRVLRAYRNLNLVLAGMYTGVNCYGVPHSEQRVGGVSEGEEQSEN